MNTQLSWTTAPDGAILAGLLARHAPAHRPLVLVDVTANAGACWADSGYTPTVRLDLDPAQRPDVVADCRALPLRAGSVDVLVFDPPHIAGAGARHTGTDWARRYGLGVLPAVGPGGVSALFVPFLVEARRVLRPGGIVLTKLTPTSVYQDRMRWYAFLYWAAVCLTPGLTLCDEQFKLRAAPAQAHSRRQRQHHTLRAHSEWLVTRRGGCQGPGVLLPQQRRLLFAAPDGPVGAGVG